MRDLLSAGVGSNSTVPSPTCSTRNPSRHEPTDIDTQCGAHITCQQHVMRHAVAPLSACPGRMMPKKAGVLAWSSVVHGTSTERTSLNTEYSWSRAGATDFSARSSSISPLCDNAPIALRTRGTRLALESTPLQSCNRPAGDSMGLSRALCGNVLEIGSSSGCTPLQSCHLGFQNASHEVETHSKSGEAVHTRGNTMAFEVLTSR